MLGFNPSLASLVFAALAVAVPSANKRATCSNGQTTADEAVRLLLFLVGQFAITYTITLVLRLVRRSRRHTGESVSLCYSCSVNMASDLSRTSFHGGQCGEDAHESLRVISFNRRPKVSALIDISQLIFHDAIGFSPALTAAGQFGKVPRLAC